MPRAGPDAVAHVPADGRADALAGPDPLTDDGTGTAAEHGSDDGSVTGAKPIADTGTHAATDRLTHAGALISTHPRYALDFRRGLRLVRRVQHLPLPRHQRARPKGARHLGVAQDLRL